MQCRGPGFNLWVGKIPLPGEFHGQRSLADYSLWGHKELDMTEQLTLLDLIEDIVQKSEQ